MITRARVVVWFCRMLGNKEAYFVVEGYLKEYKITTEYYRKFKFY